MGNPKTDAPEIRRTRILRGAVVVTVATVIGVVIVLGMRQHARAELEEAMAEANAAGLPRTFEDIKSRYWEPVRSAEDNAAPLYQQAFAEFNFTAEDVRILEAFEIPGWLQAGEPLPDDVIRGGEAMVERNAAAIELLRQASARPYARFDLRFDQGFDLDLPHVSYLEDGARFLWLAALNEARAERPQMADDLLHSLFILADHALGCDFAISYVTGLAVARAAIHGLERRLMSHPADAAAIREWSTFLEKGEEKSSFARCVTTEVVSGRWVFGDPVRNLAKFKNVRTGEEAELPLRLRLPLLMQRVTGLLDRDHAFFLRSAVERTRLAHEPVEFRMILGPAAISSHGKIPASYIVSPTVTPRYRTMTHSEAAHVARLRMMRLLLAAEALRLPDGRLPAGVEQLLAGQIEAELVDPFTLGNFQLRAEGNWLMVESPGPNSDWSREPEPLQLRLPLVR